MRDSEGKRPTLEWERGDCVVWRITEGTDARPGIDSADRCSIKTCQGSFKIQLDRREQRKKNKRQDSFQSLNVNQSLQSRGGAFKASDSPAGEDVRGEMWVKEPTCTGLCTCVCLGVMNQCRLRLFLTLSWDYEYTEINQEKTLVLFASAQYERNQIRECESLNDGKMQQPPPKKLCRKRFGLQVLLVSLADPL